MALRHSESVKKYYVVSHSEVVYPLPVSCGFSGLSKRSFLNTVPMYFWIREARNIIARALHAPFFARVFTACVRKAFSEPKKR